MIRRATHIRALLQRLGAFPVVAILGPRQVGKTHPGAAGGGRTPRPRAATGSGGRGRRVALEGEFAYGMTGVEDVLQRLAGGGGQVMGVADATGEGGTVCRLGRRTSRDGAGPQEELCL